MIPVAKIYEDQLIKEGVLTDKIMKEIADEIKTDIDKAYEGSKNHKF